MSLLWLPCSSNGKEYACNAGDQGLIPESGRSPGEENGNPLQYLCLENFMDRPWGCKELNMTEWLRHTFFGHGLPRWCIKNMTASAGDTEMPVRSLGWQDSPWVGNGAPLQYSCLENSMGRGAWWATVHGAPKNQARMSPAHMFWS